MAVGTDELTDPSWPWPLWDAAPEVRPGQPVPPVRGRPPLVASSAGLTVSAGLVHATAVAGHLEHLSLAVLFAVTALAQVSLGIALAARPGLRRVAAAAAVLNLCAVGAWIASRSVGLPLIAPEPETVGFSDLAASMMELASVGALLVARGRSAAIRGRFSPLWAMALLPAAVGMTAPHSASHSAHAHADGGAALAGDPVLSGADTSHASQTELEEAKRLIEDTRTAVTARFRDAASLLAAGYDWIGDGGRAGSYEHFVNAAYLRDGLELDSAHIESIVLQNTGAEKRVVSAMYILEMGDTLADTPDVAGDLAAWHDHQNLCWDESGLRLAGVMLKGRCFPGGTFLPTPPMLHVWLQDHECGPFAGVDGHGAACGREAHGQ